MDVVKRCRRVSGLALLSVAAALVLVACGGGTATDTVTDETVSTEVLPVPEPAPAPEDGEPAPGDDVTTEQKVPGGGKAKETEQVAPKKDQGDCPPGEVEAGGTCIPDQPSG
jgi:ABC-type glycerol-3-phosphate transport system substrate-binding protein